MRCATGALARVWVSQVPWGQCGGLLLTLPLHLPRCLQALGLHAVQ